MYIVRIKDDVTIKCQICHILKRDVPKKNDGWSFNWMQFYLENPDTIYALKESTSGIIHGLVQLETHEEMLIIKLLEIAPFNIGSKRRFDNVAGCLIAFGCKSAIKLNSPYKGYLTFVSKSSLIELYRNKYFATQTIGTRMYIDPLSGEKLINTYLKDE